MVVIVAPRLWKTDQEIRQIISEESRGWRNEIREHNEAVASRLADAAEIQATVNAKVLEGAAASMMLKVTLLGNEYMPGVLPEIRERLGILEKRAVTTEATVEAHHIENKGRFDILESGQDRIRKSITNAYKWLTDKDSGGNTGWGRIAIVGAVLVWIVTHLPSWNTIKILVARFAWMLHKGIS
jgi:hypothetical protein